MNIVIVGHVDHGKSTLIGRLLYDTESIPGSMVDEVRQVSEELGKEMEFAYLLDSLKEEREGNKTIDTTQIFFDTDKRDYVIIDAPGHVEFIKNMITGASQAEAAVLIVDASQGIEEQTKRHSYILEMLGLDQVVVAINKMDKIDYSKDKFNQVKKETIKFLKSLGIEPKYVIPISALKGDNVAKDFENMPWYSGMKMLEALDTFKTKENLVNLPFRFPVQDVYKENILVGRVETGKVSEGEEINVLPEKQKTKVQQIKVWKDTKEKAVAGESIGLILCDALDVKRGNIICDDNLPIITSQFKGNVFWMSPKAFTGEKLNLKCSTQNSECEVQIDKRINSSTFEEISDKSKLEETDIGKVTIKTDEPVVIENFYELESMGRFVLEKQGEVLGAGIVINK